jgi:hypothetical protein
MLNPQRMATAAAEAKTPKITNRIALVVTLHLFLSVCLRTLVRKKIKISPKIGRALSGCSSA